MCARACADTDAAATPVLRQSSALSAQLQRCAAAAAAAGVPVGRTRILRRAVPIVPPPSPSTVPASTPAAAAAAASRLCAHTPSIAIPSGVGSAATRYNERVAAEHMLVTDEEEEDDYRLYECLRGRAARRRARRAWFYGSGGGGGGSGAARDYDDGA